MITARAFQLQYSKLQLLFSLVIQFQTTIRPQQTAVMRKFDFRRNFITYPSIRESNNEIGCRLEIPLAPGMSIYLNDCKSWVYQYISRIASDRLLSKCMHDARITFENVDFVCYTYKRENVCVRKRGIATADRCDNLAAVSRMITKVWDLRRFRTTAAWFSKPFQQESNPGLRD